jgi:hypothetical protein
MMKADFVGKQAYGRWAVKETAGRLAKASRPAAGKSFGL